MRDRDLYIAMNANPEPLDVTIPSSPSGRTWRRAVDTALPAPDDIVDEDFGPPVPVLRVYRVEAHAMIILVSEPGLASRADLSDLSLAANAFAELTKAQMTATPAAATAST